METLTLNDGTVLERSNVILSDYLFLYFNEYGIQEIFNLLIDPEKTEKIIYTRINGEKVTFEEYTKLISVRDEGNDLITAVMRKP